MTSRHVYYSLLIFIIILTFFHEIISCPIPFDIQSKCRCAIFETGRVYIYCARQQLTTVPHFNNSKFRFLSKIKNHLHYFLLLIKAISYSMNLSFPVIKFQLYIKMRSTVWNYVNSNFNRIQSNQSKRMRSSIYQIISKN